ncbi:MAG: SLC13 family permease [Egibacteraceae bacterium]
MRLFLTADERGRALPAGLGDGAGPLSSAERRVAAVVVALVALWLTEPLHGIDATVVALAGALIVTAPGTGVISFAEGMKHVQWSLLLFLAATLVLGEALVSSGAAGWLAEAAFSQAGASPSPLLVVTIVAGVSLLAHLVITSRTARSSVLVPLVVLLAGSMHLDPTALAFLSTAAAGFCQTLAVSAKPVAMFSRLDSLPTGHPYTAGDLLRLAAVLGPLHLVLLVLFAFTVWPALGLNLTG